jgi:GNAT superfamily N-acetyltransferase
MIFDQLDRLEAGQVDDLLRMYQEEWWSRMRRRSDVEKMLAHSDVVVAFCHSDSRKLAAFARVLTDFVYKALIFDVVTDPALRGTGLGRTLMNAVVQHPSLAQVRHMELYCRPEMIPFYEKWGFTADLGDLHFMRRVARR